VDYDAIFPEKNEGAVNWIGVTIAASNVIRSAGKIWSSS
jgi:hypothetical protein